MSDVPIFRRKNSDVQFRFRCLAVRSWFSRVRRARAHVKGRRQLTIVSHLAERPTVAIWMRVGGTNYVIARGWRHTCVWRGQRGGRMIIDDLTDGRMQHSIHDLSKLCRRGGRRRLAISSWTRWWHFYTATLLVVSWGLGIKRERLSVLYLCHRTEQALACHGGRRCAPVMFRLKR